MFRLRRTRHLNNEAPDTAANHVVREAETIVHRYWLDQLGERRQDLEAALRRAVAHCDRAQRSLSAALQSGDPQRIATSRKDLHRAKIAAGKTSLAWEQLCQVLQVESEKPLRG